jgi:hypothetical protein
MAPEHQNAVRELKEQCLTRGGPDTPAKKSVEPSAKEVDLSKAPSKT